MKISLITATYNSGSTLQDTIDSVKGQDYDDLEYIIVDGGSNDNTLQLVRDNKDIIDKSTSGPDKGIYDALNKGISMATGDIVGFLHSDDIFSNKGVLRRIAGAFMDAEIDAVYSDLSYVDRGNTAKIIRKWKSSSYTPGKFQQGWMPPHPTFYLRRRHYLELGGYNLSFRISADYELMLRMIMKHGLSVLYIPETMVLMRMGGESNISWKNRWIANQEDAKAWKINNLKPGAFTRVLKPLSKLTQFV